MRLQSRSLTWLLEGDFAQQLSASFSVGLLQCHESQLALLWMSKLRDRETESFSSWTSHTTTFCIFYLLKVTKYRSHLREWQLSAIFWSQLYHRTHGHIFKSPWVLNEYEHSTEKHRERWLTSWGRLHRRKSMYRCKRPQIAGKARSSLEVFKLTLAIWLDEVLRKSPVCK